MPKIVTVALMAPPFEAASTTTALRIIDAALRGGHHVNVFAYEGAVSLTMAAQTPHPNPVRGTSVEEEDHPLPRSWIASLFAVAAGRLDWVNCGLCVDERGAGEWIDGPRRGGPKDFAQWIEQSDHTLVIAVK
jgi:tRNA 2-thiouridine synthesizing protein D